MRKLYFFALTAIVTIVCSLTAITSFDPKQNVLNAFATVAGFNVQLSGSDEVPPVDTKVQALLNLQPHISIIWSIR